MFSVTRNNHGLTLVELMIAMVIGLIALGVITQVYLSQQRSYSNQQMIVAMQQNARAALSLMKREIRMAGYRPAATDGIDNDGANGMDDADEGENGRKSGQEIGIMTALRNEIMFRMDFQPDDPAECANGIDDGGIPTLVDDPAECYDGLADDPGEQINYRLQTNIAGNGNDLVRITSAGTDVLAYDIEAIAFGYAFDLDEDGALDTDNGQPDGNVMWAYDSGMGMLDTNAETGGALFGPPLTTPGGAPLIGAVRIWLLARTPFPVRGDAETQTFQVGHQNIGPGTYDPTHRYSLQSVIVYCRNLRF